MASENAGEPTAVQLQQEEKIKRELSSAKIVFKEYRHAAMMRIEELLDGLHVEDSLLLKNLFFKDKKGNMFLVSAVHDSPTPVKGLNAKLGVSNLRLADERLLLETLGIQPGCVTPLAVLNDETKKVKLVLDERLRDTDREVLIHPMHNFATIGLRASELISFLESKGIVLAFIDCQEVRTLAEEGQSATNSQPKEPAAARTSKGSTPTETTLGVTAKKTENFPEWYTQTIIRAEMVEYYDISGCYILRPWAYHIWEVVQRFFDDKIKLQGVENCYFPMFVSKAKLEKEKEHVEGFSPEVAWVTHYGDTVLPEKVAIRPTSETIMYPAYSKWIRSHRDLPLKLNQWCNVVRWEFKQPTPFLRTREFLWQEGHTAHSTEQEAFACVLDILELYRQWYEDYLAVPVIKGEKSEQEKFAGGKKTTTIEAFIPETGRGIQAATSHLLGQNFSKMFEIEFEDEKGEKQFVHQTSWGCTTRSIGVMIMTHGDNRGLILPPKVASVQAVIVPILYKDGDSAALLSKSHELRETLAAAGIRAKVDDRTNYTPGWKFNYWELKGVPLRLEVGPKDFEKKQTRILRRDDSRACEVPWSDTPVVVADLLEKIHLSLFQKAKARLDESIEQVTSFDQVMAVLNRKHLVLAPWCEDPVTEVEIKKETQRLSELQARENLDTNTGAMKSLCIPFDQPPLPEGCKCFWSGKPATRWCMFGRSY